jgi:ATP-dependent DNA helicase RecQ
MEGKMNTDCYDDFYDDDDDAAAAAYVAGGPGAPERLIGRSAGIPDPLGEAAKSLFGVDYLFPYQRLVVTNILEAAAANGINLNWPEGVLSGAPTSGPTGEPAALRDEDRVCPGRQVVILPTGAGKSLCFQLPAMLLTGPTLVIYPILSLMADQERRLAGIGIIPAVLRGGQSSAEREAIWRKVSSGESRIIIANPEVLLTDNVMHRLASLAIAHIVIDEAHCVSDWGETFRPGYLRIGEIVSASGAPLVTAFTATASERTLQKIDAHIFDGSAAHRIVASPDRSNICYHSRGVLLRDMAVCSILRTNARPAVVFCSSRPGAENLSRYLRNTLGDTDIKFYHAGLSRDEKAAVESWFLSSGHGVLTATCAYGMGVDKPDIRTVIHRDCPPSVEAYLQESGRAGRDGKQSNAYLLWAPDDDAAMRRATTAAAAVRLQALLAWARDASSCRRDGLLAMLGCQTDGSKSATACCDVCEGKSTGALLGEEAVVNFIGKNRRAFTQQEAVCELIRPSPHTDEAVPLSRYEAQTLITQLLRQKSLVKLSGPLWKGKLDKPRRLQRT